MQITAALLAADPALTAAELAEELAGEVGRLETLRYDDGSGISAPSVAAAFELSYRQLDADAALLFRLLPADPGPDVSTVAAAALAGWPVGPGADGARAAGAGRTWSRWRAAGRAGGGCMTCCACTPASYPARERRWSGSKPQDRLLGYYLDGARAADAHLRALAGAPVSAKFAGRDKALAWLDAERPSLIAAVALGVDTGRDEIAMDLPLALSQYLSWRRRFDDLLTVLAISRDSAHRLGNRAGEAAALNNLGLALRQVRRFEEAISACQDAAAIFRETGDRHGEGVALDNLGAALAEVRRFEEAISACQDAAAICRETGDRHGEGQALDNLGAALAEVRRFEEAISTHQDAAAICRETGDRHGEGQALDNLGAALAEVRRFEEAISAHQDAAAICRETGDRHGEGQALTNLRRGAGGGAAV